MRVFKCAIAVLFTVSVGALGGCATNQPPAPDPMAHAADECAPYADKGWRAFAMCYNYQEIAVTPANAPYRDLTQQAEAYRLSIAERVDRGEISPTQATAEISELNARMNTEIQQRQAASAQITASVAQAQAARAPAPIYVPSNSSRFGAFAAGLSGGGVYQAPMPEMSGPQMTTTNCTALTIRQVSCTTF